MKRVLKISAFVAITFTILISAITISKFVVKQYNDCVTIMAYHTPSIS